MDRREIVNGLLYVVRSGIPRRMMPHDLPNWSTVYEYFQQWRDNGVLDQSMESLRPNARRAAGRGPSARLAIVDSQSAKTTESGGPRGYDGNKKILGRKRHISGRQRGASHRHRDHPREHARLPASRQAVSGGQGRRADARRGGGRFRLRRSPAAASGQRQRDGASHRPSLGTTESIRSTASTVGRRTDFRMAWTLEAPVERLRTEARIKPRNAAIGVDPTHAAASRMISCECTPTPSHAA